MPPLLSLMLLSITLETELMALKKILDRREKRHGKQLL